MTFWSGHHIKVEGEKIIEPFAVKQIDCNAYQLSIGDEVYITPSSDAVEPKARTKRKLSERNPGFTIPPGQFAFLLTQECVRMPRDVMAFISVRAKVKFRGLVNISGFHVDPGFQGRLVFSVFNAGPAPIHLERLQKCFLIWFAQVEQAPESNGFKSADAPVQTTISPDLINPISGEVQSFEGLSSKIKEAEKKLADRLIVVEREQAVVKWATVLLVGAIIGALLKLAIPGIFGQRHSGLPSSRGLDVGVHAITLHRSDEVTSCCYAALPVQERDPLLALGREAWAS